MDDRNPTINVTWSETIVREHTVSVPLTQLRALMAEHAPTYDSQDVDGTLTGATYDVKGLTPLMTALAATATQLPVDTSDDINDVETDASNYLCDCGALFTDHCSECDECDCSGDHCESCGESDCDGDCEEETEDEDEDDA